MIYSFPVYPHDIFERETSVTPIHTVTSFVESDIQLPPGGGGSLPSNRLMGMCRLMGSHFHDWIDYNGVAFATELLEWGLIFSGFGGGGG